MSDREFTTSGLLTCRVKLVGKMQISSINPDCLPEILSALALAHACEFLEEYSGVPMADWRYCLNEQALESLGQLPENQIEVLIDEQFIKEIVGVNASGKDPEIVYGKLDDETSAVPTTTTDS